jgi:transmembrane sensor
MNEKFAILLARKLSGEATVEEIATLEAYIKNNPEHQRISEVMHHYWNMLPNKDTQHNDLHFHKIMEMAKTNDLEVDSKVYSFSTKKRFFKRITVAAALLAIAVVSILFFKNRTTSKGIAPNQNIVVVKKGNKSNVELPDGTKIILNADSKITYSTAFNATTREIELDGEAYFDVAKDKTRPFIIHTKAMDIKVLGTVFNVKAYATDNTTEALLVHGSIEASFTDRPNEKIILKPNEKIIFSNKGKQNTTTSLTTSPTTVKQPDGPIITVTHVDYTIHGKDSLLAETSWISNTIVFRSQRLEDIATQLERWYNVKITFNHVALKELKFTGIFEKETIQEVMHYLSAIGNFNYKMNNEQIVIANK